MSKNRKRSVKKKERVAREKREEKREIRISGKVQDAVELGGWTFKGKRHRP